MNARLALMGLGMVLAAGCGDMPDAAILAIWEGDEENEERLAGSRAAGDLKWLSFVASYDVSEIKLARLAQGRSNLGLVKEFGAVKLARHQQSFNQAVALAAQSNIPLPAQATAIGEEQFRSLNHIGDAQFDRRFLSLQVQLHSAAAKAAAAAMGQAPVGESRNWASRAWTRWHRDEVWAGQLHQQVLSGHGGARLMALPVP